MLQNGRFIKEDPPKIGANYFPIKPRTGLTEEEHLMQEVLLSSGEDKKPVFVFLFWVGVVVLVVNAAYLIAGVL